MADVKVEALKYHSTGGKEYQVGDTYAVDESAVENLQHLGMAVRVDRADVAKAQAKATKSRSTAVAPMTTNSAGLTRRGRPPRVQPRTVTAGPKK